MSKTLFVAITVTITIFAIGMTLAEREECKCDIDFDKYMETKLFCGQDGKYNLIMVTNYAE